MTRDIEESLRDRANDSLQDYIKEVGSVNNTTASNQGGEIIDFFLGPSDTPALKRLNNGEFGGSALVTPSGQVTKATVRLGAIDVTRGETDTFLLEVRVEELIQNQQPPAEMEVDIGDFRQGVPHLRYSTGVSPDMTRPDDGIPVSEFGPFLVRAVEAYRENQEQLQKIADGEAFAL